MGLYRLLSITFCIAHLFSPIRKNSKINLQTELVSIDRSFERVFKPFFASQTSSVKRFVSPSPVLYHFKEDSKEQHLLLSQPSLAPTDILFLLLLRAPCAIIYYPLLIGIYSYLRHPFFSIRWFFSSVSKK